VPQVGASAPILSDTASFSFSREYPPGGASIRPCKNIFQKTFESTGSSAAPLIYSKANPPNLVFGIRHVFGIHLELV
jgi:hypothetical protein